MVKLFIILANVGIPVFALFLAISNKVPYRWLFLLAISAHLAVRMWETYFTSKEQAPHKFEGDWTLLTGTIAYIALIYFLTFEFYVLARPRSLGLLITGILLYTIATRLRWWGVITLGKQWAIHAIGNQKIKKARLLKIGPYEYMRHPIYSGILIEEIALPFIMTCYYSLIMVLAINIPLLIIRLRLEEANSFHKFGAEYLEYTKTRGRIFPKVGLGTFLKKLFLKY